MNPNPSIVRLDEVADAPPSAIASTALPSTTPTRTGKIARLPRAIRDELNKQLRDGVPGKLIVGWLNGLEEVQRVMEEQFRGQPVTEQNLSAWKQGGYVDWLAHEERRDWLERMEEEEEVHTEDENATALMERISRRMELVLGRTVEKMLREEPDLDSPQAMKLLLALSKEVARHRKLAMEAAETREEARVGWERDTRFGGAWFGSAGATGAGAGARAGAGVVENEARPMNEWSMEEMMKELAKLEAQEANEEILGDPGESRPDDGLTEPMEDAERDLEDVLEGEDEEAVQGDPGGSRQAFCRNGCGEHFE